MQVAVKKLQDVASSRSGLVLAVREIALHRTASSHLNIVTLRDAYIIAESGANGRVQHDLYLVMDAMEVDLQMVLDSRQQLSTSQQRWIMQQVKPN